MVIREIKPIIKLETKQINDDLSVKDVGELTTITSLTKPANKEINIGYTQKDNIIYVISRVDSQHILSDEFGDAKYMISTVVDKTPTEAISEVKEMLNIKTTDLKVIKEIKK